MLPLHTPSFSSLLFFHVFPCFRSCHLISFLCLRTHGSALHNLLSTQVSGRPGLYNEVGCHRLFLCTWFLFIATTHIFLPVRLLFMSSFLSYCAHTHTFALTLVLLASPIGEGADGTMLCASDGLFVCVSWGDIGADHSDVPAVCVVLSSCCSNFHIRANAFCRCARTSSPCRRFSLSTSVFGALEAS